MTTINACGMVLDLSLNFDLTVQGTFCEIREIKFTIFFYIFLINFY